MSEPRGPSLGGIAAVIGVGFLAVLCCGGPALLAGGALSGIGSVLGNPWLIAIGAVLIVGSLIYTVVRRAERRSDSRARSRGSRSCCPPTDRPQRELDNRPTQPQGPVEKRTR